MKSLRPKQEGIMIEVRLPFVERGDGKENFVSGKDGKYDLETPMRNSRKAG